MARPKNPDSIPMTAGIYCIFQIHGHNSTTDEAKWEECLYVGQASNLRNRVNQHHLLMRYLKSRSDMRIQYMECPFDKLHDAEAKFIRELQPTLNRAFPASFQVDKIP